MQTIYVDLEKKENGDGTSWAKALNKLPDDLDELMSEGKQVLVAGWSSDSIGDAE